MTKRDKTGATPNTKAIQQMIKEIEKANGNWQQFVMPNKNPRPPIVIPTVWHTPPQQNIDVDWEKEIEEQQTRDFMKECRERTAYMKDSEKCERCKLRFRCYTEIKVEKKQKTRVRKPKKPITTTRAPKRSQVKMYNGILRAQANQVVLDEWQPITQEDWLKVVRNVGNNTK